MRLSTTTALMGLTRAGEFPTYIESMKACREAGFKVQDINLCSLMGGRTQFTKDNWREEAEKTADEAKKAGVVFGQSHPVFVGLNLENETEEKQKMWHDMMIRSLEISSILDVRWAVLHPFGVNNGNDVDVEASIKLNMENYDFAFELADKLGVNLAYENMPIWWGGVSRFTNYAEELIALVDEYKSTRVGICWDFGHGNIVYDNQLSALRKIGKRLKMTHVADNYGKGDDHTNPFHGTTDWHSIMPVLREIGYEGDFAFETHMETAYVPEELRPGIARETYRLGQYLMFLAGYTE
jgi:sugar phosphate isomerase/epimerase